MFPLYFHIDANIGNKKSCRKYVAVQGGRLSSLLAFYGFTNISIHSLLTYAMHMDINPPACCWCRLCGMMVVRMLWRQRSMKRRWNWRKFFQKAASSAIHLIPYSVRFDGSHDRISACDAIDLDMVHTICVGEIGNKPDLSLSLLRGSESVNLSGSFYPLSYK